MPVDRGAIDANLREIGEGERWWEQREFRELPHILRPDERIRGITTGKLLGRKRPRVRPGRWLIVATNERIICLRQERFARKQVDMSPGQITSVQQSTGLRSYQIVIQTQLARYRIRIAKTDAFRFAGAIAPLVPDTTIRQLNPVFEPFTWIPGFTTMAALPGVSGIVSKVAVAPAAPSDAPKREELDRLQTTVDRLESDVERLQQQVAFLEDLLQKRSEETFLARYQSEG
jgi:hypothetical protein